MLDFLDSSSPQLPPAFGNMQNVLHENIYTNENPVAFELLILCVLGAIEFRNLVRIVAQL